MMLLATPMMLLHVLVLHHFIYIISSKRTNAPILNCYYYHHQIWCWCWCYWCYYYLVFMSYPYPYWHDYTPTPALLLATR